MPPKRSPQTQEAPPPPPKVVRLETVQAMRQSWLNRIEGEVEARTVIDEVVERVEREIVRTHMDHTAVPWTIQGVVTDLMEALQLNYVEREEDIVEDELDFTATEDRPAVMFDVRVEVDEPEIVVPDSWSRASIPHRKHLVRVEAENKRRDSQADGNRRRGVRRGSASPDRPQTADTLASTNASSSSRIGGPRPIRRVNKKGSRGNSPSQTNATPENDFDIGPTVTATEAELRRLAEVAAAEENMAALRSVADRVDEQFHQLVGKEDTDKKTITVDGATHTVMYVKDVDPKHLPDTSVNLGFHASDDDEEKEPAPEPKQSRTWTPSFNKKPKKRPAAPGMANFFQEDAVNRPMIEDVNPNPGVTSRDGDSVKSVDLKPQKLRMARSEYAKISKKQRVGLPDLDEDDKKKDDANGADEAAKPVQKAKVAETTESKPPAPQPDPPKQQPQQQPLGTSANNKAQSSAAAAKKMRDAVKSQRVATPAMNRPDSRSTFASNSSSLMGSRVSTPALLRTNRRAGSATKPREGDTHSPNQRHLHPLNEFRPRSISPADLDTSGKIPRGSAAKYAVTSTIPSLRASAVNSAASSRPQSRVKINYEAEDDASREFLDSIHISVGGDSVTHMEEEDDDD